MSSDGTVSLNEWLRVLENEYLRDYASVGGAAVKFAVTYEPADVKRLRDGIAHAAARQGFHFTFVDGALTKVHLVEQVFFAVARQTDWDRLIYRFTFDLLSQHYRVPRDEDSLTLRELARLNEYEERQLNIELQNRLKNGLLRDYAMALEFRSAMVALVKNRLDPEGSGTGVDDMIKQWLRGELRHIKPLRDIGIFQKIGRTNARYLLNSLSHWLKYAGHKGLVMMIDIGRYLDNGRRLDGTLSYGKTALLDCYEVLRQFVDSVDESENFLMVVAAPRMFAAESEERSVDRYQALKLRIWDDVRDRKLANPLAPMVRLSTTPHDNSMLLESTREVNA